MTTRATSELLGDRKGSVDIDPSDGGREFSTTSQDVQPPPVPTVLTKLEKWGAYESMGDAVKTTRFVPMKTPLSEEILANWSLIEAPRHRLTVGDLLQTQSRLGRHVGMILDLSNHDCLYTADLPPQAAAAAAALVAAGNGDNSSSPEPASTTESSTQRTSGSGSASTSGQACSVRYAPEYQQLEYRHIKLVAKELPAPEFVTQVCQAADQFWAQHPDDYIAIHCAYGFNRTGFVVCCYLIERRGMSVDQALEVFKAARPPGVKHEQFRAELKSRYEPDATPSAASPQPPHPHQDQHHAPHHPHQPGLVPQGAPPWPGPTTPPPPQKLQQQGPSMQVFAQYQRDHPEDAEAAAPQDSSYAAAQSTPQDYQQPQRQRLNSGSLLSAQQQQQASGGARLTTPMSENDSLGFSDRMALQSLRAQHQAATGGPTSKLGPTLDGVMEHPGGGSPLSAAPISRMLTPGADGDSITSSPHSICTPKSMSGGNRSSALGRKSISEIVWSTGEDDAASQLEARRSGNRAQASSSAGGAPALGSTTSTPQHRATGSAGGSAIKPQQQPGGGAPAVSSPAEGGQPFSSGGGPQDGVPSPALGTVRVFGMLDQQLQPAAGTAVAGGSSRGLDNQIQGLHM